MDASHADLGFGLLWHQHPVCPVSYWGETGLVCNSAHTPESLEEAMASETPLAAIRNGRSSGKLGVGKREVKVKSPVPSGSFLAGVMP